MNRLERKLIFHESVVIGKRKRRLWHQGRSCAGKIRFTTETKASQAAADYTHSRMPIVEMGAYGCRYCQRWHIGHDNKAWKQAKDRRLKFYADDICRLLRYSAQR